MNDINFSLQIKKSNTDEWYTPVEPVKMIVPYLKRAGYHKILCPFDKAGSNFVRVLKKEGFDVTYSHIETGTDFFDIKNLRDYDAVVSNPPFSNMGQTFTTRILKRKPDAIAGNGKYICFLQEIANV